MRYLGINTIQPEDLSIAKNADDKLSAIGECPVSRLRRKESVHRINAIEKSTFASINDFIGWIGTTTSPICAFYASYLQQKAPETQVHHLVKQTTITHHLKNLGTTILHPRPKDKDNIELSVLLFADASRVDGLGQLGVVTGLLVGPMEKVSIHHVSSWICNKTKRPVRSIPAAEVFAAAEGLDDGKVVCNAYNELLNVNVKLRLCVDSKDFFSSLSTQKLSIHKSIRGYVSSIRYEFQTGAVDKISWIPGTTNIADPLTKKDSCLTNALHSLCSLES